MKAYIIISKEFDVSISRAKQKLKKILEKVQLLLIKNKNIHLIKSSQEMRFICSEYNTFK